MSLLVLGYLGVELGGHVSDLPSCFSVSSVESWGKTYICERILTYVPVDIRNGQGLTLAHANTAGVIFGVDLIIYWQKTFMSPLANYSAEGTFRDFKKFLSSKYGQPNISRQNEYFWISDTLAVHLMYASLESGVYSVAVGYAWVPLIPKEFEGRQPSW